MKVNTRHSICRSALGETVHRGTGGEGTHIGETPQMRKDQTKPNKAKENTRKHTKIYPASGLACSDNTPTAAFVCGYMGGSRS